ncbi:sensor histidine kinase [Pseudonocardia bannensis]|uniref:histidine kinase n=1 Tax=Pseudonocardia bannensis TaxID=630973 RepID=A0A848DNG0_9PSEU|nr:HAMP domain-containing sensor histidine kinase [Pseudonocardia bannensis]NMH94085.1 hypothetical protein [Pseudonocardia bannensis]
MSPGLTAPWRPFLARWVWRRVADVLVTAGVCAVVAVLVASPAVIHSDAVALTGQILTISAAAVGAGAAILAVVASRLLGDPRPAWLASALVLYCVIVLPWSTVAPVDFDLAHRASRLVAYLTAMALLLLSIRPPRPLGSWGGWVIMFGGGLLAVGALNAPDVGPVRYLVEGPAVTVAVLVGWTAAGIAFVVDGFRRQSTPRSRLGLGLVVLAVAQLYRVGMGLPGVSGNLVFSALRLTGLIVVLIGLAQLVQRALTALRSQQWEQQEELSAAALHMERATELAAERDHELRNGLAGLAGITHLLSSEADTEDHERLRVAVLAELGRLRMILGGSEELGDTGGAADRAAREYRVEPVLAGLVMLRRSRGAPVELEAEPGLTARGDSAVLAQVITNLLANCDRHAPGAPVTIRALPADGAIAVEVRDHGPGLRAGSEEAVFGRGVRDESAGGSGLGLHISRQLLAREGGSLELRTVTDPPGCLARVTVPAVDASSVQVAEQLNR